LIKSSKMKCPNAERVSNAIFSVPCHGKVKEKHVEKLKKVLVNHLGQ